MLRRSFMGSLRCVSPFSSPTLANESSFRSDSSRQSGRDTPASHKEPRILKAISENERGAPELDRSIDLVIVTNTPIEEPLFERLLTYDEFTLHDHPFFELPVKIRRRIYDYCFPDECRKITLSPRFATKAVFPDGYFASPWSVLDSICGGLHAFRELRHELMIFFWTEYHFHVTLSPFNGPRFCPLSHIWLPGYLDQIQHLTVEVDLTRFGFSPFQAAPDFGHDIHKMEEILVDIVNGLTKRRYQYSMEEFNIMCRRYAGFRPYGGADDATFELKAVPYCPENVQYLCDVYCELRGMLRQSRISGFSLEYTETLFRATFAEGDDPPDYDWACGSPWPAVVPPQTPYENFHPSFSLISAPPMPMRSLEFPFTPASTFSQDVQDEMQKYDSSIYSPKTPVPGAESSDKDAIFKLGTSCTLAEHVQKYSECVQSIADSDISNWSSPRIRFSTDSQRHLLTTSPAVQTAIATPKTGEKVERMNEQNEQDPAFVRTVDALRSLSEDINLMATLAKKPPSKSSIPSPKPRKQVGGDGRSQTSMGTHPRAGGTMRRYLSFVKRLRGRTERGD